MLQPQRDASHDEVVRGTDLVHLRELVQHHQVCWESRPEQAVVEGTTRQIGFVIEITATHDHPHRAPVSGCPECDAPLHALEAIVGFVLPKGPRDSVCDVQVRWGAIEYAPRRSNRPEVSAKILVLHAEGIDRPVDPCEERCRAEIVRALEGLGACERSWASSALGS